MVVSLTLTVRGHILCYSQFRSSLADANAGTKTTNIFCYMNIDTDIQSLEARIDSLIGETRRLIEENQSLKENRDDLMQEKTQLREKNRLA